MKKGFTLIEAIIVISIITLLVGLTSLSMVNFGKSSEIDSGRTMVVQALREAQSNSLANLGDNPWGVHFEVDKVVIFQDTGTGYNPADSANNRVKLMPKGVSLTPNLTGATLSLFFNKGKGTTLISGDITLTSTATTNAVITINNEGRIDY